MKQLPPAALGLRWITEREEEKKQEMMSIGRKMRVHHLIIWFVQEEVKDWISLACRLGARGWE